MKKNTGYTVETSFLCRDSWVSYENNEYFSTYEEAKKYFDALQIEKKELKTLWIYDIDTNGDFDNFEELEILEG